MKDLSLSHSKVEVATATFSSHLWLVWERGGWTSWPAWDKITSDLHGGTVVCCVCFPEQTRGCLPCVMTMVSRFCIWRSDTLGFTCLGRGCPAQGWRRSGDNKVCLRENVPFTCTPTRPGPATPNRFLYWALTLWAYNIFLPQPRDQVTDN